MASSLKKLIETLDDTKIDSLLSFLYMCIWAKYIAIVEHKANSVGHTIKHAIKSLLGIYLELGDHVRKSTFGK
jgi:hypothetical protein